MLKKTEKSLPAKHYFDPDQYRRELDALWYREWLCIGHAAELNGEGAFRLLRIGDQQIIVTRSGTGAINAFHNTCRHRGSVLCTEPSGQFRNGRITCPYHAWIYSLDGDLVRTPRRIETDDFDPADFPLYKVPVHVERGFVFICLEPPAPGSFENEFSREAGHLDHWPLESLQLAHQEQHHVRCNWKVFWENYLECYHCPGVHPELCRLVPMYGETLTSRNDLPDSSAAKQLPGSLAPGAATWSQDGQTPLPPFEGLTDAERAEGMHFADSVPGAFVVAHQDYVRSVHVLPVGPEQTLLTVNWYVDGALDLDGLDVERLVSFARTVVLQDAQACELNQQGLRCIGHQSGVLVPQEEWVFAFHQWLRERLAR